MNTASGVRTRRADLIRFLQSIGHIVTVVSATDRTADDLRTMGVTFVHWPISRQGLNPFAEALSLLSLRNILFHLQPHVILCFTLKAVLYGSLAARTIPRSTVFSVFAGLGHLFSDDCSMLLPFRPLIQTVFRYALKNNPVVFFQNPDDLELFVTRGIVPQRRTYRLYGSGVDTARFSPNSDRVPSARTTFIMIARLIRPKGILDYIQAATILKREGYDVRALLLGPFDDHPTAIDAYTIHASEASGVIEYLGRTSDVRPYLDSADVFVLPSYYREGTPRSTLEAMAMGKPVITTDAPGCRETVIHDSNGYLVPVRDPVALAGAMRKLVGARDQIRIMGLRSRELAEELYDVDKVNAHLWREIDRILEPVNPTVNP